MKQRIIVVIIGISILGIGALIFSQVIGSQGNRGQTELVDLAAYQTELARVISIGVNNARDTDLRSEAAVTRLSVLSDLAETKSFIKRLNLEPEPEELNKFNTPAIDAQLEEARKANNFDAIYKPLIDEKVVNYQKRLESTYNVQSIETIKNALSYYNDKIEVIQSSSPADTSAE